MESKFSHLPDIKTIQPDRLIKYRVSEDKFSAEVLLPGLSYTDFDQKIGGKIHFPALAKICESVRFVTFSKDFTYFARRHRNTGAVLFVVSQMFSFTHAAHNLRGKNHYGINKPQRFLCYLSHAGKTSYTTNMDWFDSDNCKIGSFMTKHVAADVNTRRPVPLPDYFFKDIESHFSHIKPQTMDKADIPIIPSNAYQLNIRVLYSDCDDNYHVNQATYLKWCSDAASEGAENGYFSYFKNFIELYPVKDMKIYYSGEGLVKDELVVHVWECKKDASCLEFAILKQENVIFHMGMTFYDSKIDKATTKTVPKL
ncbi:uncharacterized protein LOC132744969 isoform X3 [Ruditapes philippinarum]|uniref:uncharacterized protein LOC132744969 isoform X3 n=1 Tax=Ruditapes philippinarum TaxID=129788 RepID=UPI00295A6C40|nr:uncharacterized protein LOC132744969 isoform X3 [Ruditapes philippinarum]